MPPKLTPEQIKLIQQVEANKPAAKQVRILEDIAKMFQELLDLSDSNEKSEKDKEKAYSALLMDIRESLNQIKEKEDPKTPDFSKPIVQAVSKMEKAIQSELKALELKSEYNPQINVDAPQVTVKPNDLKGLEKILKTEVPKAFKEAIKLIPEPPKEEPLDWKPVLDILSDIDKGVRMKPQMGSVKVSNLNEVNVGPSDSTVTSVGDSTTSAVLIDSNPNRKEVEFYNNSTAVLYLLKGGGTASSSNYTVTLAGLSSSIGGYYRTSFTGQFSGVWASDAGGTVQISESV